jgi:hypothetical protein
MKTARFVLVTAIALLMAAPVCAQEKQAKKKGPAVKISTVSQAMMRMKKLHDAMETLDLTADQEETMKTVRDENGPKMKKAFEALKEILTEEQRDAAETAMKEAREAKKSDRMAIVAVEAAVKATDEQKKKMDVVGKDMLAMQREIMKKTMAVLTDEQKEKVKKAMMPKPRTKKEGAKGGKKKKAE